MPADALSGGLVVVRHLVNITVTALAGVNSASAEGVGVRPATGGHLRMDSATL